MRSKAISVDLDQQKVSLNELHIDRAYLSSHKGGQMMLADKNWVLKAVVEAPPDTVFQHIVAMKQKEIHALGNDYSDALKIDATHHMITLTGHWWYQGVHTVLTHPKGSQVTYKVSNIAKVARTLAFLQRPLYVQQMRRDFEQMLHQICSQIGCGYVIEQD